MRLRTIPMLVAAAVLSTLSLAQAQQPPTIRADIASVRDGDYPNASAVVNFDDAGRAGTSGLTRENFTVTIDGTAVPVAAADLASSQNLPLDVLFVMDTSGSMAGEPLARAKDAAKGFLTGLAPADRVALLSFDDEVRLVQDYTIDRALIGAAIEGLSAHGNTALYQATAVTAIKVNTSTASRRAVIFLSDGAQDGVPLTVSREQAIAAAGGIGVPFFNVGEGTGIDREYLQQLAQVTRGRYLEAPDPRDLTALYAGVGQLLRSQYIVTFDASSTAASGSTVAITIQADGQSATASAGYKPGPSFAPAAITISGVKPGDSVTDARTISIAGAPAGARASYVVDGVNVFETVDPPYTYVFDPRSFAGGAHTLSVSLRSAGKASDASVSFLSVVPPPPVAKGGAPNALIFAGAGAGLLLAIVVFVLVRVRNARREEAPNIDRIVAVTKPLLTLPADAPIDDDSAPPEVVGEALGVLISRAGSDVGSEYGVGGSPVSIGSSRRCAVYVPDAELTAEEARIWIRKGHLMVHKMTRLTAMVVDGTSGGWEILEPGDTFIIGEHRFEFRLLPAPEATGDPAPNVLRGPDAPRLPVADMPRSGISDLMPRSD